MIIVCLVESNYLRNISRGRACKQVSAGKYQVNTCANNLLIFVNIKKVLNKWKSYISFCWQKVAGVKLLYERSLYTRQQTIPRVIKAEAIGLLHAGSLSLN